MHSRFSLVTVLIMLTLSFALYVVVRQLPAGPLMFALAGVLVALDAVLVVALLWNLAHSRP